MTELQTRIEELLFDGLTEAEIAAALNISEAEVEAQIALIEEVDYDYEDGMDGDFDSAMASAGFGTDEDYGYYGDE